MRVLAAGEGVRVLLIHATQERASASPRAKEEDRYFLFLLPKP